MSDVVPPDAGWPAEPATDFDAWPAVRPCTTCGGGGVIFAGTRRAAECPACAIDMRGDWARTSDAQRPPETIVVVERASVRRRGHGAVWWLLVGWWWRPACWCGRVLLWLVCWPLGLWRSIRHGQRHR